MDREDFEKRSKELAMKFATFAYEQGYDLPEVGLASMMLKEASVRAIVLDTVLGDMADDVREAILRVQAEKAIEEAEEALRNGDQ